jgi:hypothetical protein
MELALIWLKLHPLLLTLQVFCYLLLWPLQVNIKKNPHQRPNPKNTRSSICFQLIFHMYILVHISPQTKAKPRSVNIKILLGPHKNMLSMFINIVS